MTAYNIVNPAGMVAGQPEDISIVLSNLQTIAAILNGSLDNGNLSPAAAIDASKLAGYPADVAKVLKGDGTWGTIAAAATTDYGTALPATPTDGREYILVDSLTAPTYQWRFRYNAGATGPYKWEFIGGAPAFAEVDALIPTTSATYAHLSGSVGPVVAVPRAGDYDVEIGARVFVTVTDGVCSMSYDIGATGAVDLDAMQFLGANSFSSVAGGSASPNVARSRRKTFTGALTLTAKYKMSLPNNAYFSGRWMKVTPVRVA